MEEAKSDLIVHYGKLRVNTEIELGGLRKRATICPVIVQKKGAEKVTAHLGILVGCAHGYPGGDLHVSVKALGLHRVVRGLEALQHVRRYRLPYTLDTLSECLAANRVENGVRLAKDFGFGSTPKLERFLLDITEPPLTVEELMRLGNAKALKR